MDAPWANIYHSCLRLYLEQLNHVKAKNMCGIAGLIRKDCLADQLKRELQAMADAIAHRGPDGQGIWISPHGDAGFAHRRLAIIDLSDQAAQPMQGDGISVTYNGEIYNHLELRRELRALGYVFRTDHADTEVLLHGFRAWGIDGLLERLNGIFAFALYDSSTRRTWLARDHVGVKPLYFTNLPGDGIAFASEIKGLLALSFIDRRPDPIAVWHYLTFMTAPPPSTLFSGICKLPAGHLIEIYPDRVPAVRQYWDCPPSPGNASLSQSGLVEETRRLVLQAVRRQAISDVPVGVFLSGGVDSSALLTLGTQFGVTDAFSVGFHHHPELNEIDQAAATARAVNAKHHVIMIDDGELQSYTNRLVHDQDEPIADWVCVPLNFVSRLARDAGMKVVLVGEGADEQFCGYTSYRRYLHIARREWRVAKLLAAFGLARPLSRHYATQQLDAGAMARADFLRRAAEGESCFLGGAVVFWETMKQHLAGPALRGALPKSSGQITDALLAPVSSVDDDLARMTYLEFKYRLPELLLMRVDKITMANSLEARVPFLDRDIVDFTMRLRQKDKIPGGNLKHLLRQALRGILPDELLDRPKRGFGAPMSTWMRGPFGLRCREEVLDSRILRDGWLDRQYVQALFDAHIEGTADNALFLWSIFNLTAWHSHWMK